MVIKKLPQIGDPILRKRAKNLTFRDLRDPRTKRIIKDLIDTMRERGLVGIAAPQLGESVRIFVVEVRPTKVRKLELEPLRIFINPRINWKSKQTVVDYEGCGSVLNGKIFGPVRRHKSIVIEYDDIEGGRHKLKATGNLSIIVQHEYDHLNGILFTDKLTDNKKILDYDHYLKMRKDYHKSQRK
ncbi:MAG: peptide deformylase [Patescibacteria group bacterium]|nr:peptide deformylase [Patescibacteria group bacterium]